MRTVLQLSPRRRPRFAAVGVASAVILAAYASVAASDVQGSGTAAPFAIVLGIAQDAGVPQAGTKAHPAWTEPQRRRLAACLGIVDPESGERWMVEATPDFREQLHRLDQVAPDDGVPGLEGILLTHAHIGHYTGLVHLGHEAIGAAKVPVYAMPRMSEFLRRNGPWNQLVRLGNIVLRPLADRTPVALNGRLSVMPFRVPHREEYSEVVGFRIQGPKRALLFLPDIDKWGRWDEAGQRIEEMLETVDAAFVDGTFFDDGEIPGRDMSTFPHPFMFESLERFQELPASERAKVRFIHLNHTNPALDPESQAHRALSKAGLRVAAEGERIEL